MSSIKGSGSIIQKEKDKPKSKCRKWQLRVSTGCDPRTGKYKTKVKTVTGTYSDAKAALREFIKKVEEDRVTGRTKYTFEEYAERFLAMRAANKEIAPTTLKKQSEMFKAVNRHIGKAKLESITPIILNDMYAAMLQGDTLSGKKSGGSHVNQIHANITLVFEHAKKEGIIAANPCDNANPPKKDTKERRALKPEQAHLLIAMLDERKPNEMAYLLAATLGLRRGEICGLSWGDIDWEKHIVDISHSFDTLGNLKGTKTKAGMRLLPLPDLTYNALLEHKKAQKAQFDKTNSYRKPHEGYIVQDENSAVIASHYGQRILPSTLSRWWAQDRASYGLEGWCLHELRHTYLTLLAINGVHPKIMQELAGHYSSQITMDIYTHVNMDSKRDAVDAVSKVF